MFTRSSKKEIMKNLIVSSFILLSVFSCKRQGTTQKENILIGDKAQVTYIESLVNNEHPAEWLAGMNKNVLFDKTFNVLSNNQVKVYTPDQPEFKYKTFFSYDDIIKSTGWENGLHPEQFIEILFCENWFLSKDFKTFTKEAVYWCPIQVWDEDGQIFKRKMFYAAPTEHKKGELIAENIFTEFDFTNRVVFPSWNGFDPYKFFETVFDKIMANELAPLDPVYIVDGTETVFTPQELTDYIGLPLDSEGLRGGIESFIFQENWYFDEATMNIYKDVKSIGFVRKYWEDEQKSKILFFLKFK